MNIITWLIALQGSILTKVSRLLIFSSLQLFFITQSAIAAERWIVDNNISKISFEVPVLFASNVIGSFNNFEGLVQIDLNEKLNNKAIFSVSVNSIQINYKKYKDLLLGPIFFDATKFPLSVLDTKSFKYENDKEIRFDVELLIKDKSKKVPINLSVTKLTKELVQVKGELYFNRSDYGIGIGKWKNTTFLKDRVSLFFDIFLFKD